MRDITASTSLVATQIASSVKPYVKFNLTAGTASVDYTTRVLSLEHHEEPYNEYATVVLQNNDKGVSADLRGYWTQIAYGYTTNVNRGDSEGAELAGNAASAEYSYTPRLWVKNQMELSSPGNAKVILELEGMWSILKETQWCSTSGADIQSFYFKDYAGTATTAYAAMTALVNEKGFTIDALGTQDDGIINTVNVGQQINGVPLTTNFDSYAEIIYRLLTTTKCYLRSKTGLAFKVIYPCSTDAVNKTYYSDQQPIFTEYLERKKLLIPNHIYCIWGEPYPGAELKDYACGTAWGQASDTAEIALYRDTAGIVVAAELASSATANTRAEAKLSRLKSEQLGGHLVIRHDCTLELYDRIEIDDSR